MSVGTTEKLPRGVAPDDPFYIGWRDVEVPGPNGDMVRKRIPLTLEDALHPLEGDVIPMSRLHFRILQYLFNVFCSKLAGDPTMGVFSDMSVYWDHPLLDHHSPDVCVIPGIRKTPDSYVSFYEKEEGTRPTLIVEAVSPNTRVNDVEKKMEEYHLAAVPHYVILDRVKEGAPWKLCGYEFAEDGYQPMPLDAQGRLWLDEVGVWLEVEGQEVRCIDGETGEAIPEFPEARERLTQEKARADEAHSLAEQANARADQANTRVEQLAEELAKLKASLGQGANGAGKPQQP